MEGKVYRKKVKNLIENKFFEATTLNESQKKNFFSDENMEIWERAFTHETFSSDNYETLEFLGDRILETCISKLIYDLYPDMNQATFTQTRIYYTNKHIFRELSLKYNFNTLIRTNGIDNKSIHLLCDDVFESFFGALFLVSNSLLDKMGYIICDIITEYIFGNIIEKKKKIMEGPDRTTIDQIAQKVFRNTSVTDDLYLKSTESRGIKTWSLIMSDELIEDFKKAGKDLKKLGLVGNNGVLGKVLSNNKEEARDKIYKDVSIKFEKKGINKDWGSKVQYNKKLNKLEEYFEAKYDSKKASNMIENIKNRIKDEGYDYYILEPVGKKKSGGEKIKSIALKGVKKNEDDIDEKFVLLVYNFYKLPFTQKNAVENYLMELYSENYKLGDKLPELLI